MGLLALAGAACGVPGASPGESVGVSRSAIVGGAQATEASVDYAVRIVSTGTGNFCTGTLVAPDLVLTTQHCLVSTGYVIGGANDNADCMLSTDPSPVSSFQSVNFGPSQTSPLDRVPVKRVFVDESNIDCTKDIAAVQLTRPPNIKVTIHPLLLDPIMVDGQTAPILGDTFTQVGWGITDDMGTLPTIRQQQSGKVLRTATGLNDQAPVNAPLGESVGGQIPVGWLVGSTKSCNDDSGSPWIDENGWQIAVVGQITSGRTIIIGANEAGVGGAAQSQCSDSVTMGSPLQSVVPFITLIFQSEGRMPWRAPRPAPPLDVGGACTENNECNSNYCVKIGTTAQGGGQGICSSVCSTTDAGAGCPADSGTVCTSFAASGDAGPTNVCIAPQASKPQPECSVSRVGSTAGGAGRGMGAAGLALMLLGGSVLRRKKRGQS